MPILLKYFLAWFPMLLIAIGNGLLRELVIKAHTTDLRAHQISTFTLLMFFAAYIWLVVTKIPPLSGGQALLIGLLWLVLTLAFEFGFGRYRGRSWEELLADYRLLEGRLWVLIPLWVAIAPWLFYRLRR